MGFYKMVDHVGFLVFLPLTFKVLVVPEWDDLGALVHSMLVEAFLKNDS